jgi:hypothetical protein
LYYARKQTAANAAAAKWVDSIYLQNSGQPSPEDFYCVDDLALQSTPLVEVVQLQHVDNASEDENVGVGVQAEGLPTDHPNPMERLNTSAVHKRFCLG